MATKYRIYMVVADDGTRSLVRAANKAQAVRHAARKWSATVATQDLLIELLDSGVGVESAVDNGDG